MGYICGVPYTNDSLWVPFFSKEKGLIESVLYEVGKEDFYPDPKDVFRFTRVNPNHVKAVIVGMDPYASSFIQDDIRVPVATGRSFEVKNVATWQQKFKQSSLQNILKAAYAELTSGKASLEIIREELRERKIYIPEPPEFFNGLESKGVMFLNTALTVRPDEPGSHIKLWRPVFHSLVRYIAERSPECIWLLFGRDAREAAEGVLSGNPRIKMVTARHPRLQGFAEDRTFRDIAGILKEVCNDTQKQT